MASLVRTRKGISTLGASTLVCVRHGLPDRIVILSEEHGICRSLEVALELAELRGPGAAPRVAEQPVAKLTLFVFRRHDFVQ